MSKEIAALKHVVAVIDIGSSAIRMVIAEVGPKTEIRYLENLQKPVRFGREVFTTGKISSDSMRQGIEILKNYKTVIEGYGIRRIQVVASSAVREAVNRDNFIDQVYVRTGIDIEILEGPEENRLELTAVENALGEKFDFRKSGSLIVEVGSGSTEMIVLNKGEVEVTRTLSLGSIRLPEQAAAGKSDSAVVQQVLKRSIRDVAKYAAQEYSLEQIDTFIALGGDMRFASRQLLGPTEETFTILDKKTFTAYVNALAKMTTEEVVEKYGVAYDEAEALYHALLYYFYFLTETRAEQIVVPMMSIRDGILIEMAQMLSNYRRTDVSRQVIHSARHLGEKYKYDEAHAKNVASNAVKLFDLMQEDHGLSSKERLLLEVSSFLHDIGMYVAPMSHHKHSSYLVDASDIFGLRKSDKNIVSNVVRYHRRSFPRETHVAYMSLPKTDRAVVSKLAAILRVADGLDKGHQQKIKTFSLEKSPDAAILWVDEEVGDISVERDALQTKGSMFADVFGLPIILKQGRRPQGSST